MYHILIDRVDFLLSDNFPASVAAAVFPHRAP